MIDLSSLKAPGWQRVVAELAQPAADDRVFALRMTGVLGQVAGARQAVFWSLAQRDETAGPEPRASAAWPYGDTPEAAARAADAMLEQFAVDESTIPHAQEVKAAARSAGGSRQTQVFGLEGQDDLMYDPGSTAKGSVIAVPVTSATFESAANAPLLGVVTLLVENRSRQALQTTLALVEVIAGYAFGHASQLALRRVRGSTAALDLAARLISSTNGTEGFKGCTLQLVNDLARQLTLDRVALGWIKGPGSIRAKGESGRTFAEVIAMSDTEQLDRRMSMVQKIEAAMDECLDQDQPVLYPPPPSAGKGSDVVLGQAITHAHRDLASSDAKLKVASFPLRVGDPSGERTVGIVTLESAADSKFDAATIELIQAALDLVAPVLWVRYSDDRNLALRAADSAVKGAAWFVGPKHTVWKIVGVLATAATCAAFLVHIPYRFGAPFELQAQERRVISAPFDGTIRELKAGALPGDDVAKDQVLFTLDTRERELSALESQAQLLQHEREATDALRRGELDKEAEARAKADQARARLDLLRDQIDRSSIRAPIAGRVVSGDLRDRVKASVKLGDKLLEVADLSQKIAVVRVQDQDIGLVSIGQTGQVTPKSDPSKEFGFVVERIVPLAQPKEGDNSFDVYCRLSDPLPESYRPGMEGQAKFNGASHSLAWIATRRVIDTARVWLWW
ncbi:MAG: efflux RND transporter periplasmic adaptor subunit [Phycisphaerales bacterium]